LVHGSPRLRVGCPVESGNEVLTSFQGDDMKVGRDRHRSDRGSAFGTMKRPGDRSACGHLLEAVTPGSRPGATRTTSLQNSRGHGLPTTTSNPSHARSVSPIRAAEPSSSAAPCWLARKKDSAVRSLTEAVARLIASQRQDFQPIYLLSPKQRVTTSSTLCWPQRFCTRRTSAASRRGLGCMQNG